MAAAHDIVAFRLDHGSRAVLDRLLDINGRERSEYVRSALRDAVRRELAALGERFGKPADGAVVTIEDQRVPCGMISGQGA